MECCICLEQATHEMKCSTCMSSVVCHNCFTSIETDTSDEYIYVDKNCPICRAAYIPNKLSNIVNHFLHLNQGVSSHTNKITKIIRREQYDILDELSQELNEIYTIFLNNKNNGWECSCCQQEHSETTEFCRSESCPRGEGEGFNGFTSVQLKNISEIMKTRINLLSNKMPLYNNIIIGREGMFFLSAELLSLIDKHIGYCIYPTKRTNCFRKNRIHIIAGSKKVTFQKDNNELITLRDIMNFLNKKAFIHRLWDYNLVEYGEDYDGEEDYIYRICKARDPNTIYLEMMCSEYMDDHGLEWGAEPVFRNYPEL